jgi:hypothetical protein
MEALWDDVPPTGAVLALQKQISRVPQSRTGWGTMPEARSSSPRTPGRETFGRVSI